MIEELNSLFEKRKDSLEIPKDSSEDDDAPKQEKFVFVEFMQKHGFDSLPKLAVFTIDEFESLCNFLKPCLQQSGRGRRGYGENEKLLIFLIWDPRELFFHD